MRASTFIATSLDGYIARENGDIDWLMSFQEDDPEEDYGYAEFFDSVDCLVMGRGTMETVAAFPEWPYEGKRVVVLSHTLTELPPSLRPKAEQYSGPLPGLLGKLATGGCSRIYVDGGKTIQSFLHKGLLTDINITTIPVLLGRGRPLFGDTPADIILTHDDTRIYPNGLVRTTCEL